MSTQKVCRRNGIAPAPGTNTFMFARGAILGGRTEALVMAVLRRFVTERLPDFVGRTPAGPCRIPTK